jgi:hypothetical protein
MKRKGAKIFDYQDWQDELSAPIPEQWSTSEKGKAKFQLSGDSPQLMKKREEILAFMKSNESVLREFEKLTLEYARVLELEWPTVYPVIVKAAGELNDRSYVNARVFWPMYGGKKKELRFYICPYTEDIDIKSESFKVVMMEKVGEELKKRFESDFFVSFDKDYYSFYKEVIKTMADRNDKSKEETK